MVLFSAIVEWPSANLQMARQVIRCVIPSGYSEAKIILRFPRCASTVTLPDGRQAFLWFHL
jgi:hypothetical protein